MGILPPAGLRELTGFTVEVVLREAGLLGASLAAGGLRPRVETAGTKTPNHEEVLKQRLEYF